MDVKLVFIFYKIEFLFNLMDVGLFGVVYKWYCIGCDVIIGKSYMFLKN